MRANLACLVFCVIALPAVEASAEDTEAAVDNLNLMKLLNVQVSTATKTTENIDDAPALITVVTRETIHQWGYRNIGEVLNRCVGFFPVDDHIQPNVAVRGMTSGLGAESGSIKVMIDGRSVAYRTTSGNWLGAELIPLESIQQIEIIRGPASALYGADAFLGVVNIITESPDSARPIRARVFSGFTGENLSHQIDVAGNGRVGPIDLLVGAIAEKGSRSGLTMPEESPAPNYPSYVGSRRTALNLDRLSLGLQFRAGYRVADKGHIIASAYGSGFRRGGDFAPWAQLTNGIDADGRHVGTIIAQKQSRINIDGLLQATQTFALAVQSTYFQGGILPSDRIDTGSDLWYARRRTSYRGIDSTLEARFLPSERFNAIVGVECLYDSENLLAPERINRATDQVVPTVGTRGGKHRFSNVGSYVSSNYWLVERWLKLTAGLRFDNHSTYGAQWTGRFGATSRLAKPLVLKLLYGSAFKAPSPYLLYAAPLGPGDVQGNASLKPQKVHTVETQLSFRPNAQLSLTTGIAYSKLLDKAEFSPQGINQVARNTAKQDTLSWETRADFKRYDDYQLYLSWEMMRSRRDLGETGYAAALVGNAAIVYPSFIGRMGAMASVPSLPSIPLSAAAEGMLVGPRRAADASVLANGAPFTLPTYATLNLFLTTRDLYIIRGHESVVALRVYNVLSATGPNPGYSGFEYPLSPREIWLELRHSY